MRRIDPSETRRTARWCDRAASRGRFRSLFCHAIVVLPICLGMVGCAVQEKREAVVYQDIPIEDAPTKADIAYGRRMLRYMLEDYPGSIDAEQAAKLDATFSELAEAAGLDPDAWNVRLLHAPAIADVRAVEGNYLFVWSGLFDLVESDDELAGLIACEIGHLLAGHAEPVRFTPLSELLFGLTDAALTVGAGMLSQGMLNLGGVGFSRSIYIDANDLNAIERAYSPEQLQEMAPIAAMLIESSTFSPEALLAFWRRVEAMDPEVAESLHLARQVPPVERVAILEAALSQVRAGAADDQHHLDAAVQAVETDEAPNDLGSSEPAIGPMPDHSG